MNYSIIDFWDYLLLLIYSIIVFFFIRQRKKKNLNKEHYSFFTYGWFVKLIGGIGVCFIYIYYYGGGDTIDYFWGSVDLSELFYKDTKLFFSILFGDLEYEKYVLFSTYMDTHTWSHIFRDPNSYSVIKFTFPLSYISFRSYLAMTILMSSISYIGIWKLFSIFFREFIDIKNRIAFAFLFVPSVIFWGSGILKDTYTFSATCWLVYSFYKVFIDREKMVPNIIAIVIMAFILLSIRPFMLYIALVSVILMLSHSYVKSVKGGFLKFFIVLMIITVFWGGGIGVMLYLGKSVGGGYKIDNLLEKAAVTQQDLTREYYGENSFDIGAFEPTIPGILSKAPIAINAGLYYPYIWTARNPVMLIAGLENLLLLLLSLYVLILIVVAIFKIGPRYMLKTLFDHPLVVFSLSYAIPFAFMVGLTTANYGALVRYKIPLIPFFLASLFIIIYKFNRSFASDDKAAKRNMNPFIQGLD